MQRITSKNTRIKAGKRNLYEERDKQDEAVLRKISRQRRNCIFHIGERGGEIEILSKLPCPWVVINETTQEGVVLRKPSAIKQESAQRIRGTLQKTRKPAWSSFTGQIWDKLSIIVTIDSNGV